MRHAAKGAQAWSSRGASCSRSKHTPLDEAFVALPQVNNHINSTAVMGRVDTIQDKAALQAMFKGVKKRPQGWRNSDSKLVTFDNLMVLTLKVLR